ncbi:UDP-glucose/GDP-mannose dehydrogenase family protein [Herbaspirillum sp. HC18]|nr:UDP-glucose/GDP-mannose dehydrogenase family protein [Herbaspirillum sp. HC18]
MRITIIGTGYVGLVTGACFAQYGNDVLCLDVDVRKIELLQSGRIPIYEPGLEDMVRHNVAAGRLRFTADVEESVLHATVQMIAVDTPPGEDGAADLRNVLEAARNIGRHMIRPTIVVNKSTVPVGTADKVGDVVAEQLAARGVAIGHGVVSNPEFLKEGTAVEDFMKPERVIVGVPDVASRKLMHDLYAPFVRNHDRILYMDVRSAELSKYAANAMLATRISFMNELANLAEAVGADIEKVRLGIGSDRRIGYHFLYPGIGYGGSCFPKDVQALQRTAQEHGRQLQILQAVEAVNRLQKGVLIEKIVARYGENLAGRHFAVWGLAFKPNTADIRNAPSLALIDGLLSRGATVKAYDPAAMDATQHVIGDRAGLSYAENEKHALIDADALAIVTEWKAFRSPDFGELKRLMKAPVIFDGRNLYDPARLVAKGFHYDSIGRKQSFECLRPTRAPGGTRQVQFIDAAQECQV